MLARCGLYPSLFRPRAATVTYLGSFTSETDLTTYSDANFNFGPERDDRWIAVGAFGRRTAGTIDFSSGTAGGIALETVTDGTTVASLLNTTDGFNRTCLLIAKVPGGVSGQTISITWSAGAVRGGIAAFSITGLRSALAFNVMTNQASPPTGSVNAPANGGVLAVASSNVNSTCTWTGLDEDLDVSIGSNGGFSAAHRNFPYLPFGKTVTATFTSHNSPNLVAASFGS